MKATSRIKHPGKRTYSLLVFASLAAILTIITLSHGTPTRAQRDPTQHHNIPQPVGTLPTTLTPTITPGGPTFTPTYTSTPTYTPTDTPTPPPSCWQSWYLVGSPNVGAEDDWLSDVTAISSNDVWAVGAYTTTGKYQTLIEHWDGTSWSVVPSPNMGTSNNILYGVTALSSNNVWAVGAYALQAHLTSIVLIEHWDGTQWSVSPVPEFAWGQLFGVSAISSDDIWAVGDSLSVADNLSSPRIPGSKGVNRGTTPGMGAYAPISMHWDGSSWHLVAMADVGAGDSVGSVAALAANNVWAVGYVNTPNFHGLIEHWDGTTWNAMPGPTIDGDQTLDSITAISPDDMWVTGYSYSVERKISPLILHWDGSIWSVVQSNTKISALLSSVSPASANDIWAVGNSQTYITPTGTPTGTPTPIIREWTLTEHWNGDSWTQVESPNAVYISSLSGVSVVSPNDVWAVGSYGGYGHQRTLIEHYNGGFTDVYSSDYFYTAAQYLNCNGAISGYSDSTFRPDASATRSQLCKIIVLAKGWAIDITSGPHFSDVPPDSPFYNYIETCYNHGIISGYSDGTFRPYNSVTRAQLCKVIMQAQQWPVDTAGGPHFTDVPPTNPSYPYIETVYNHAAISGYSDGTFRPNNIAKRGQISKIVYNAIRQP